MCVKIDEKEEIKAGDICPVCNSPYVEEVIGAGFGRERKLKCKCDSKYGKGNKGWNSFGT